MKIRDFKPFDETFLEGVIQRWLNFDQATLPLGKWSLQHNEQFARIWFVAADKLTQSTGTGDFSSASTSHSLLYAAIVNGCEQLCSGNLVPPEFCDQMRDVLWLFDSAGIKSALPPDLLKMQKAYSQLGWKKRLGSAPIKMQEEFMITAALAFGANMNWYPNQLEHFLTDLGIVPHLVLLGRILCIHLSDTLEGNSDHYLGLENTLLQIAEVECKTRLKSLEFDVLDHELFHLMRRCSVLVEKHNTSFIDDVKSGGIQAVTPIFNRMLFSLAARWIDPNQLLSLPIDKKLVAFTLCLRELKA